MEEVQQGSDGFDPVNRQCRNGRLGPDIIAGG
jgi:hypothetical protein